MTMIVNDNNNKDQSNLVKGGIVDRCWHLDPTNVPAKWHRNPSNGL